jgi:hypothetical protein
MKNGHPYEEIAARAKNSLDGKPIGFVHCKSPAALPVHRQINAQPHSHKSKQSRTAKGKDGHGNVRRIKRLARVLV